MLGRLAKALNRSWERRGGGVFDGRYHSRALKSPRQVRNAIVYVLHNGKKHGCHRGGLDPFTSGGTFDGWSNLPIRFGEKDLRLAALPRTWLLSIGWRRHGLVRPGDAPARRRPSSRRRHFEPSAA